MTSPQTQKATYQIQEDPFYVSSRFKQKMPMNKNMFELNEPEQRNYMHQECEKQAPQAFMLDPFLMKIAITKFLLTEKLIAYFSIFSLFLSIYQVYFQDLTNSNQPYLLWFGNAITLLIITTIIIGSLFEHQNMHTRKITDKILIIKQILKIILITAHPTTFTQDSNNYLHLAMLLRILFPMSYYIQSSIYFDSRAARLINIYGIKQEYTFIFALKMILNVISLRQVLFLYVFIVFFYSHCLYLVSDHSIWKFIDCFEVVIVTLPTVGFGDYEVVGQGRIIILLILITGIALNAFVTLSMLKQFEMTKRQDNSYTLLEKLRMTQEIERLSTEYIVDKISKKKFSKIEDEKLTDEEFKDRYLQCKAKYRMLNFQDYSSMFNHFKNALIDLKIKSHQASNMTMVFLRKITRKHHQK